MSYTTTIETHILKTLSLNLQIHKILATYSNYIAALITKVLEYLLEQTTGKDV